ncbi:peptidase S8/S53 domain-containing protein [Apiospora hydei]|uniref:Peptidase S8/S53 domain-containing protein n=1 Tax=Apiospora hydei TaxID=1337664 RepID=A0ABR1VKT5_9PEZI
MRVPSSFIVALLAAAAGGNALATAPAGPQPQSNQSKRYIIELKSQSDIARIQAMVERTPGLRVFKTFDHAVFPAISVECYGGHGGGDLETMTQIFHFEGEDGPGVDGIYESVPLQIIRPIEGESFSNDAAALNYSFHGMTGVEKLHKEGITGEGAIVAVIDTGIDYRHPALGGGIGDGYKVIGGLNLPRRGHRDESDPYIPDSFVEDTEGHGTHVAGIVAGKGEQFVGVAPDAKLLAYRVSDAKNVIEAESVRGAIEKAVDDGADIITISLGSDRGSPLSWGPLASKLVSKGVFVSISAGNDGKYGPFTLSGRALCADTLTVAASDPVRYPAYGFTASHHLGGRPDKTELAYTIWSFDSKAPVDPVPWPSTIVDWPIIPITRDISVANDACSPLAQSTAHMTGTIVLVRSGGCSLQVKLGNLEPFSPQYVLFYQDDSPFQTPPIRPKAAVIDKAAGEAIIKTILEGNLELKPDVSAPGVGKNGGRAAHENDPEWARRLMKRITSTAHSVPWAESDPTTVSKFFASPAQVGTGFVDAARAMAATTELSFHGRGFELKDPARFVSKHSVNITNVGMEPVTYTFSLQSAGGFDSSKHLPGHWSLGPVVPMHLDPLVSLPKSVIVGAGETKAVEFAFKPPTNMNSSSYPFYSGKVLIKANNSEEFGIPYLGAGHNIMIQIMEDRLEEYT